ncbi:efflux RND transporter permease subunit [Ancylobacter gelatini]|uniref:efflux RND transporter permease subunit n=1 Tax=Ancylobacter gelatini TaxID=2919920 RepID=UPI003CC957FD
MFVVKPDRTVSRLRVETGRQMEEAILTALPLSVGGALGCLLLGGHSFSMSAMIGIVMLMGIAAKNSILLVEYAITARADAALSRADALIDAARVPAIYGIVDAASAGMAAGLRRFLPRGAATGACQDSGGVSAPE